MSLDGAYDPDNVFAKILRGDLPSVRVYEDEHAFAFMDVFPQAPGHVLVIPKGVQARNIFEIEPSALAALVDTVQRVAKAVKSALAPDGVMIAQFNGAAAGQTVYHLHFHIIPRSADAPLKGHGHGVMADIAELEGLARRISAMIS